MPKARIAPDKTIVFLSLFLIDLIFIGCKCPRDWVVPARISSSLGGVDFDDGLAERGRRRAEEPLLGWNRAGLESYIDSDY